MSIDEVLAVHKLTCYRGIARVPLESLDFRHALTQDQHRPESEENIRRLQKIFARTGCLRLQDENVINALVEEDDLALALTATNITKHEFRNLHWAQDAPMLRFRNVKCLSGLHRIRAADRYLDANDKWWIVRFFSHG